jgi:CheY-like chemotaxis protein
MTNKVLIVEDDESTALILREIVGKISSEVVEAHDGKTALDLIRTGGFDVVILDLMLPEMSGQEILESVNIDPKCKGLKVLVNSTSARFKWTKEQLAEFTNLKLEILPRPADPEDIVGAMKRLLGTSLTDPAKP